jgi:hypothetical protein
VAALKKMRDSVRKNRRALSGNKRFEPACFGFRNTGGKSVLSSPEDQTGEFIPETGRWKKKVRNPNQNGANPDKKKIG